MRGQPITLNTLRDVDATGIATGDSPVWDPVSKTFKMAPGGSLIETVHRVTTAGTTQTIPDVTVATISYLTLTATSCAVTLPTAAAGKSFTVVLEQDATGGRHATWVNPSGSVKWAGGGAAPVLTVAASQADVFTFLSYDGANYAAFIAGQNI